ncbi:MAG: UDP-N-acetylmuramoyl-tripeptide--D-alanyl-D-alanine ligase, partial [Anaerolinea sp.]|nr:UDP-N-acetylmuramoyl-tripeptide--D-alanyl-D-alanine ligase [Anaerolinea sp.]
MISLYDILDAGQGQLFGEPGPRLFSDLCVDPAQATDACLYAALRTDSGDGHLGIADAVARGAGGIIATRPPELDTTGLSVILVKDVLGALMSWSHAMIGKFGVQVIAVAGGAVRPVAVDVARAVLSTRYRVVTDRNGGPGRISIPLTTARLTAEDRFVIFDLDAAQPGEMSEMISAAQPHAALIPQIGMGFSDRFGSPEAFVAELSLIVDYLSPGGVAVINYDDDRARALLPRARAHTITIGIDGFGADLVAYNIVIGPTRTGFDLRFRDQRYLGRWTPLLGQHQLYALLGALGVGAHYEIPLTEALRAVAEIDPLPGHMKPFTGKGGALLIDNSASADPTTTLSALEWLNAAADPGQRKIFILGDLDRLGEFSQRSHRLIGQRAAELSDLFITHGADAALAGRAALDHGMDPGTVAITYSVQDVVSRLKADEGGLTDR